MVNVTISLSEETIRRLRKVVSERFASKKGALSGFVEDALHESLARVERAPPIQLFSALKENRVIARARSLESLASELRRLAVNPRGVRIVCTSPVAPVARAGFRGKRA